MAIARAPFCNKHKPRVYKDQCLKCKREFEEQQLKMFTETTKETSGSDDNDQVQEEKNAGTADDSAVATEGE